MIRFATLSIIAISLVGCSTASDEPDIEHEVAGNPRPQTNETFDAADTLAADEPTEANLLESPLEKVWPTMSEPRLGDLDTLVARSEIRVLTSSTGAGKAAWSTRWRCCSRNMPANKLARMPGI